MKELSAFIEDVSVKSFPATVRKTIEGFITVKKDTCVVQYGMVASELITKADPQNLETARKHVVRTSKKTAQNRVRQLVRRGEKFILLLNDRIIDGHHFLALAEHGGVTSSLPVLDLKPARFQLARRLHSTISLSDRSRWRDAAVGTGAVAAGAGAAYAGYRVGRAADQVGAAAAEGQKAVRGARVVTTGVGRKIERASRFIKRTLSKIPGIKLMNAGAPVISFDKKTDKKGLNPYVGAALSGAASGAVIGAIPILRRGARLLPRKVMTRGALGAKGRLKLDPGVAGSVAGTAAVSAGIVGGGAVVGSKILGDPDKEEGAPFTKRAALGGGIAGATVGIAGGLLATRTRAGRAFLAKNRGWRPVAAARKGGPIAAAAIGGIGGGAVGVAQGADEGQQVDSIRNLRKDMKKKTTLSRLDATLAFSEERRSSIVPAAIGGAATLAILAASKKGRGKPRTPRKDSAYRVTQRGPRSGLEYRRTNWKGHTVEGAIDPKHAPAAYRRMLGLSARLAATIEFIQRDEAGIPFTGKVAKDRYIKKLRDEDLDRRDANLLRAGVAGAAVGLLTRGKLSGGKRAAIGAAAGGAGVLAVRQATSHTRDVYGERSRGAKRAESIPTAAGAVAAGALAYGRLRKRFAATLDLIEFGKRDQPRLADNKQWADSLRAYGDGASLVDADGNPTRLTQTQLVNTAWRSGQKVRKTIRRGTNLVRDVADAAAGRPRPSGRKREWEKEWFRNALLTTGSAGALLGHAVLRRKVPAYRARADRIERGVREKVSEIRSGLDRGLGLEARRAADIFFARVEATLLFDALANEAGWDVRDPRGKSARVFAPGSRKRNRRPASWHETKDGQRKILGTLAVVGTGAGLAGGILIGRRLKGTMHPRIVRTRKTAATFGGTKWRKVAGEQGLSDYYTPQG